MSTPSNQRKREQDYWLDQPQEERGLSPERQQRQPLGFRSKRQYRDESIYGWQDAEYRTADQERHYQDLVELFGGGVDGEKMINKGFIVSSDPQTIERDFKILKKLNQKLEETEPKDQDQLYNTIEEDFFLEPKVMPSGKTINKPFRTTGKSEHTASRVYRENPATGQIDLIFEASSWQNTDLGCWIDTEEATHDKELEEYLRSQKDFESRCRACFCVYPTAIGQHYGSRGDRGWMCSDCIEMQR